MAVTGPRMITPTLITPPAITPPTITLPRPAGFSLAASSRFVRDFPASPGGEDAAALNLAFALDRTWQPVGVRVCEQDEGIVAQVVSNPAGASEDAVRADLVRILNLQVADDPLIAIGSRDPVVEQVRQRYPGLRPVQFPTPWEAAAWAVIGTRIRMSQAAEIKKRLATDCGHRTEFPGGQVLDSFPGPDIVLSLPGVPGLGERKFATLRGIARAAVDGALDAETLGQLPEAEASTALQGLYGIGPFSAELILARGVGVADLFPTNERRLARAMTLLYDTADPAEHLRRAEEWRPYRSWVALLLRRWLADEGMD